MATTPLGPAHPVPPPRPQPTTAPTIPAPLPSPHQLQELHQLLGGHRVSQAIYVIARLGIADLLADGPQDGDALARATGTHAAALCRVLRLLAGVGLFEEVGPRRFGLTVLGSGLRTDVPGSRRPWALMLLDATEWQAWGALFHTVTTGETAFNHVHGVGKFEYLGQHPDAAATFQDAMTAGVAGAPTALTDSYNFSQFERVVDVGGGQGALLATVLKVCPTTRGVVFDRSEVVAGAAAVLAEAGVADRCEVVAGDFFAAVPPDGDAYILRQIIHDWGDPQAVQILQNCRSAIRAAGRLLVVERAIAADLRAALPVLQVDLQMLVSEGGRERTDAEYGALFAEAGFRLSAVVPLGDAAQFTVFEGVPG